jgi:hypothetical protein
MKMLRLLLLVFLAASLSVLLSGTATASDHPWDDSTVDSTETTGYSETEETETGPDTLDDPISIKIKNWFLKFLRDVFAWEVKRVDNDEVDCEEKRGGKVEVKRTFVNVRTRVL